MKHTWDTQHQLEELPIGFSILSIANKNSVPGHMWDFQELTQDVANENLYRAEFVLPSVPDSILLFTYELLPKQDPPYRCTILKKITALKNE